MKGELIELQSNATFSCMLIKTIVLIHATTTAFWNTPWLQIYEHDDSGVHDAFKDGQLGGSPSLPR